MNFKIISLLIFLAIVWAGSIALILTTTDSGLHGIVLIILFGLSVATWAAIATD